MLYDDYLKELQDICPFCDKERFISQLVAENDTAALILSLAPYQRHHLLIIPKRHLEKILEIKNEEMKDIIDIQNLAVKILYQLGYTDMSVLVREGEKVGKSVKHLHYHIIPEVMLSPNEIDFKNRSISDGKKIIDILKEIREALSTI